MFEQILFVFRRVSKIAKSVCSFIISVRLFVRRRETMDFHELGYLSIFRRCVEEKEVLLESYQNNGYFTLNIITRVISMVGFTVKPTNFKLHF